MENSQVRGVQRMKPLDVSNLLPSKAKASIDAWVREVVKSEPFGSKSFSRWVDDLRNLVDTATAKSTNQVRAWVREAMDRELLDNHSRFEDWVRGTDREVRRHNY